jgi:hypothetical protein
MTNTIGSSTNQSNKKCDKRNENWLNVAANLQELNTGQTAFNAILWCGLVDYVRAESDQKVTVVLHGGG